MEWNKIQIQSNSIEAETNGAYLINMPKVRESKYKGYSFWMPKKLCSFVGKNNWLLQIRFPDDFVFHVKKYGKGQYNFKKVLNEKDISPEDLMLAFGFGSEAMNEDLSDLEEID